MTIELYNELQKHPTSSSTKKLLPPRRGKIEMGVKKLITAEMELSTPSSILPSKGGKYDYGVLHPTR
jgi:hypothetical protein